MKLEVFVCEGYIFGEFQKRLCLFENEEVSVKLDKMKQQW